MKSKVRIKIQGVIPSFYYFNWSDNGRFWTIKTNLDNMIMYTSECYPKTKEETVGILNN